MRFITWSFRIAVGLLILVGLFWVWGMPKGDALGTWQHEADGTIIEIDRMQARLFHHSGAACTLDSTFPAHFPLVAAAEGAHVTAEGDRLELRLDSSIGSMIYSRIPALPEACSAPADPSSAAILTHIWTVMEAHYPFFDLHGVDWDSRRPALETGDLSDEDLFAAMRDMVVGLDDGHIQIIAGDLGYASPSIPPAWLDAAPDTREALNQVARDNVGTPLDGAPRAPMEYGLRDDGIGYVLITGMWTEPRVGQSELASSRNAFETVAAALSDARAIIVDVRYNPGGNDGTALTYAGFFTDQPMDVLTKRTRKGDGWTEPVAGVVSPIETEHRLTQPVILLTSKLTGSGAEIFTMAMRELPQVTVMGEATGGGLSDILGITLANGWLFGLSNQEYRAADGEVYEGRGVPPDVMFEIDGGDLSQGADPMLAAAIARALE